MVAAFNDCFVWVGDVLPGEGNFHWVAVAPILTTVYLTECYSKLEHRLRVEGVINPCHHVDDYFLL